MPQNAVENLAAFQASNDESSDPGTPTLPAWPKLDERALHGIAGRYVRLLDPNTEADPTGILVQFLVMFGNVIGRGAHFKVEADEHHLNLYTVLVGASAKGRKGVSAGQAKRLFESIDTSWCSERVQHGLSSGEGLIHGVRDAVTRAESVRARGRVTDDVQEVLVDAGVDDKRLLVFEAEFASTLRVMRRDGSTLSATIRNAWDTGDLRVLTKSSPTQATGAHISIVGHVTKDELLRYLDSTEAGNGFGNRFLWCCVKRSKLLPEGGNLAAAELEGLARDLRRAVGHARRRIELRRDERARDGWYEIYGDLSEGRPGLLGSMIARAEAQVMRLACIYALLDVATEIQVEHLQAALALWTYCEESARWIFGESLGDPMADEILTALRRSPEGLTRTDIQNLFRRHRGKAEINRALGALQGQNLATMSKVATGGRPVERWKVNESRPASGLNREGERLSSHTSLSSHSRRTRYGKRLACEKSEESEKSPSSTGVACERSEESEESAQGAWIGSAEDSEVR